jgi:hypothetical protein
MLAKAYDSLTKAIKLACAFSCSKKKHKNMHYDIFTPHHRNNQSRSTSFIKTGKNYGLKSSS